MSLAQDSVLRALFQLSGDYTRLTAERDYLQTGVTARLAELATIRQELLDEANLQLDRLNALRVADGLPTYTLQDIRKMDPANNAIRGPRGG